MNFKHILAICIALAFSACRADYTVKVNPDIIMFSQENYTLGVIDSEEWLEIPISATDAVDYDRNIGVEVIAAESSAIEGLHYVVESNTLTIAKGKLTTALRIRGIAENIGVGEELTLALNLVLDEENVSDIYGTHSEVKLQRCCKFDINNFVGEKKNTIVVKDMFYEGYDIEVSFDDSDPLAPRVILPDVQVLGSTGEAFGTIYGDGKLLMSEPMGYTSYFGACENFMVLYTMMYVENVGTVGTYVNIFEWISKDEAERIKREGF